MRPQDILWPTLERPSVDDQAMDAAKRLLALDAIRDAEIAHDEDTLIEEARRLADLETDRRRTSETKAAIYLTVVGVLSPILATIAPETLAPRDGWPKLIVTLALFILAGLYLLRCGGWAFKAIQVQPSAHPDAVELATMWRSPDRKAALARDLLKCVRLNREGVNLKVTAIKMAHEFATRAFAMFVLALLVRAGWKPLSSVLDAIGRLLTSHQA